MYTANIAQPTTHQHTCTVLGMGVCVCVCECECDLEGNVGKVEAMWKPKLVLNKIFNTKYLPDH